jgi:hypothetical protein
MMMMMMMMMVVGVGVAVIMMTTMMTGMTTVMIFGYLWSFVMQVQPERLTDDGAEAPAGH